MSKVLWITYSLSHPPLNHFKDEQNNAIRVKWGRAISNSLKPYGWLFVEGIGMLRVQILRETWFVQSRLVKELEHRKDHDVIEQKEQQKDG